MRGALARGGFAGEPPTRAGLHLLALLAVGCGLCGSDPLATLTNTQGEVSRDRASEPNAWIGAAVGDEFRLGEAVKTATESGAKVELRGGGGVIELVENTIVRFLDRAPEDQNQQLSVELGEANLTAGTEPLRIVGEFGAARLSPGSRMRVSAVEGSLDFEVLMGAARIERTGEEVRIVRAGDPTYEVDFGPVQVEPDRTDAGVPDAALPPDAGPPVEIGPEIAVELRGRVERQDAGGEWERIPGGTEALAIGTRVRLARGARITVRREGANATLTGAGEATVGGAGGALAAVSGGRVTANASTADAIVQVPGGAIVARAGGGGGRAEIRLRGGSAEAEVGAEIRLRGGSAEAEVGRGAAELRGTAESLVLRSGESGTLRGDGTIETENRSPARAHIAITAGSSIIVHDPDAPTSVRIRFASNCPGEGVVEVGRGARGARSFGTGQANILVSPGSHRYRVRCAVEGAPTGDAVAEGTINVRRDSGRAQLPRRASRNVVDADGRRYTILYQNLLPIVSVRWPNAPASGTYTFVYEPRGGAPQRFSTRAPQYTLDSGEVGEGAHRLYFEAPGGTPARSPVTTINVSYDNASSAVFLREPGTAPLSGGAVTVSGSALDGWSVSVNGAELPLDNQYRFSGTASLPSDVDALAIRLVHPRHGVHYYLRRIAR
jgi:hypothetical protein